MRYLLDTPVKVLSEPLEPNESPRRARMLSFVILNHEIFCRSSPLLEIAIKSGAGEIAPSKRPAPVVPRRMADQGLRPLPISHLHALAVGGLPNHHHDPFDRLLIAQANIEDMILITSIR